MILPVDLRGWRIAAQYRVPFASLIRETRHEFHRPERGRLIRHVARRRPGRDLASAYRASLTSEAVLLGPR
jgi:hypothetical protein